MKHTATIRRHASAAIDPSQACALDAAHPALQGAGRTLFPTTVVGTMQSPRFLVSGHNNPKLGKEVLKGDRIGWPIFHVTLEERSTCPRSCEQWASCYGNAMPQARRHAVDDDFLPALKGEVITVARQHPKGLLVRLHALGDFYSLEYVYAWAELLAALPQLHVFGYTARRVDDADPASAKIARAIALLTEGCWDRFAIRTSSSAPVARSRSIVVDEIPTEPDVIVCPAQTGATEACATCGLCWAGAARDKTIAFLRHGMKRSRGPRVLEGPAAPKPVAAPTKAAVAPSEPYVPVPERVARQIEAAAPELFKRHPDGVPIHAVMEAVGATYNQATVALNTLHKAGKFAWIKPSSLHRHKLMRPAGSIEEAALTANQESLLRLMVECAEGGLVRIDRSRFRAALDMQMATLDLCVGSLRQKGFTEHVGASEGEAVYRILKAPETPPPPTRKPPPREMPADFTGAEPPRSLTPPDRPALKVLDRSVPAVPAAPPPPKSDDLLIIPVEFDEPMLVAPADTLLRLKAGQCRWPTNSPKPGDGHLTKFCRNKALDHCSYCAEHEDAALGRSARRA